MPGDMYECDCALWTLAALITVPPFVPIPPITLSVVLREDGGDILREDGGEMLREDSP
jgi:hypothetical protein